MEITTAQAAAKLGVTAGRIRQMVLAGQIKARLLTPRLLLIDERDLAKVKRRKVGRPAGSKTKAGR